METVFSSCNVCGRSLVRSDELSIGMCAVCANEEIDEETAKYERYKTTMNPPPCVTGSAIKPIDTMKTKDKLISALTQYDAKQAKRKGHNPYALGIYFQRVDDVVADIEAGADIRAEVVAGFTGRLADHCLRALGLPITTDEEQRGGYCYKPVKANP